MIIRLLRYIRGYLDIRFEGAYSEKILSALAQAKIPVWRLRYLSGTIYGSIFAKDFRKLFTLRKKIGVKIHIDKKHGFPFVARRYKRRAGFAAGAALFFAILKFLSGFVWIINVEGNVRVSTAQIIKSLQSVGVREEMRKSDIDPQKMAQELILSRNDIAWASLNIEGCVLNVNVTEIKEKTGANSDSPTNLIAAKDGIIRKIDAVAGNVRVRVGENVHKGDVMVSGIIENMSGTEFVRSNARIIAQVEETYTEKMNYSKTVSVKTGNSRKEVALKLLGVKVPLYLARATPAAEVSCKVVHKHLFGRRIPFTVYKKTLYFTAEQKTVYSEEELKELLTENLNVFLEKEKIDGYIPTGTEFITDSEGVTVRHRYLCDKNIALESKIIVGQ